MDTTLSKKEETKRYYNYFRIIHTKHEEFIPNIRAQLRMHKILKQNLGKIN